MLFIHNNIFCDPRIVYCSTMFPINEEPFLEHSSSCLVLVPGGTYVNIVRSVLADVQPVYL